MTAVKLRDLAYDSFTERLLARDIRPGQFVSQRELVALTGVPLGAIRELVPRLEAEGLIRTVPQRGMQVAHVDVSLIRNAFQFRLFLEREATEIFARDADDAAIARLKAEHVDIVVRAADGVDDALIAEAQAVDLRLHETIVDHLDNEIVSKAFRVNWIKVRLTRQSETRLFAPIVVPVMRDHLAVIEALERRDAAGAVDAITQHITKSRNRALDIGP
jgi:DNA-binding GntR family transcriptional regulator